MILYLMVMFYLMVVLGCYGAMDTLNRKQFWGLAWVWPILLGFAVIYIIERMGQKDDKQ